MVNCAVINCKNTSRKVNRVNGGVSYHSFPDDPYIKEKWIDATGTQNWFPTKHSKICSIHFRIEDFSGSTNRTLSKKAFPTINILQRIVEGVTEAGGGQNIGYNFSSSEASNNTPSETILEDINEPGPSNEQAPFNSSEKRILLHKLKFAQEKLEQKGAKIKRLREQHRRKVKKIQALVILIVNLKKKMLSKETS